MRVSLILFGNMLLAQNALCVNIPDAFQRIEQQQNVVKLLETEIRSLNLSNKLAASSEIIDKCIKALDSAKDLADKTNKEADIQNENDNGVIDGDALYTAMINSVRHTIEVAEAVRLKTQDGNRQQEISAKIETIYLMLNN